MYGRKLTYVSIIYTCTLKSKKKHASHLSYGYTSISFWVQNIFLGENTFLGSLYINIHKTEHDPKTVVCLEVSQKKCESYVDLDLKKINLSFAPAPAKSSSVFLYIKSALLHRIAEFMSASNSTIHNHKTHSLASLGNVFLQIFLAQVCCLMVAHIIVIRGYKNGLMFWDDP